MNETTREKLNGEGDTKVIVKTRTRIGCHQCGEPAMRKHTFLLPNARSNPNSRAFGRDDCSWCEDECRFVCEEHNDRYPSLDGYSWCSTFTLSRNFEHLFLEWDEKELSGLKDISDPEQAIKDAREAMEATQRHLEREGMHESQLFDQCEQARIKLGGTR